MYALFKDGKQITKLRTSLSNILDLIVEDDEHGDISVTVTEQALCSLLNQQEPMGR